MPYRLTAAASAFLGMDRIDLLFSFTFIVTQEWHLMLLDHPSHPRKRLYMPTQSIINVYRIYVYLCLSNHMQLAIPACKNLVCTSQCTCSLHTFAAMSPCSSTKACCSYFCACVNRTLSGHAMSPPQSNAGQHSHISRSNAIARHSVGCGNP
jgi:hypothetical protein